jgi:hypothetical protein
MHFLPRTIIAGTAVAGLMAPAVAADLTASEIKALISGKTVYLEATAASSSGQAGARRDLLGRGWYRTL